MDFAAAGLLDDVTGDARAERLRLLTRLAENGVTPDELRAAAANGTLLFVGAERVVGGGNEFTLYEVATTSGLELPFIEAIMRVSGVAVPARDERVLGPADLALAELVARYRGLVNADDEILEMARVLARALTPVAEVMRRIALKRALRPGATEDELAVDFAEAAKQLAPMLEPLLGKAMSLHLRNMMRTEAVNRAELDAGSLPGARHIAVCFADIVGFTRAGELLDADGVGQMALRLEHITDQTAAAPVRKVKTLGDGIMLVSDDLKELVDAAIALVDLGDRDELIPSLRAGVAHGEAVSRAGDWFGRPVNLASRLTNIARPGTVLADQAVFEALGGTGFAWSYAGSRRLRSIREPTRLYRARRTA